MSMPTVLLVGGPDVDARIPLMLRLQTDFKVGALGTSPTLRDRFNAEGFRYRSYRMSRKVDPILDLLSMTELVRIFRRLRPQVVHAFDAKPGVWGCLAARLAGVPVVISTVTGLGSLYGNRNLTARSTRLVYLALRKLSCAASDLTIFQNRDDAREFVGKGIVPARKSMIIPGSGVPTDVFAPTRVTAKERDGLKAELGIKPSEVVVTMVSRVMRSKGVLDFVEASQAVKLHDPDSHFVLVGAHDAESMDHLTDGELARLERMITWTGPRQDVPVVLAASDIFVLPSAYREGVPRVLLEAASMGLPIVTTDTPGCNDVVEDGINGYLVPARDPSALREAIQKLLAQPDLRRRFGLISRQRAVDRFDLTVVAEQTRSVYRQLLDCELPLTTSEA